MADNLVMLTQQALFDPLVNIRSHTMPNKSRRNMVARSPGTCVGYSVDGRENLGAENHRNQRVEASTGGVTPE